MLSRRKKQKRKPLLFSRFYIWVDYTNLFTLTFTPGPMVGATTMLFMNWPFRVEGLAFVIAPISVEKFGFSTVVTE